MIFLGVPLEGGVLEDVGIPEKVDEAPWDEGLGQKDGAIELEDVIGPVPKSELGDVVVVLVVEDGVETPEDELVGGVRTAWRCGRVVRVVGTMVTTSFISICILIKFIYDVDCPTPAAAHPTVERSEVSR